MLSKPRSKDRFEEVSPSFLKSCEVPCRQPCVLAPGRPDNLRSGRCHDALRPVRFDSMPVRNGYVPRTRIGKSG